MKFKKLIFALVCIMLFSFGIIASASYGVGDSIEGIEITKVASIWDETFTYYIVTDEKVYLFNNDDTYFSASGVGYTINYTVALTGYGRNGGSFSHVVFLSSVASSNFDIYDTSGNKVFPLPPPTPTPTQEPTEVIQMMEQGVVKVRTVIIQVIIVAFSVLSLILLSPLLRRVLHFLKRLLTR